jgi:hypothetical protein
VDDASAARALWLRYRHRPVRAPRLPRSGKEPDKAAEIICRGVERGKARILVGPDAYVFDGLARVAPTHYYDVVARFERRLRSRQTARG